MFERSSSLAVSGVLLSALLVSVPALSAQPSAASVVAKKAAVLSSLHRKARKAIVNAAQDKAFTAYYESSDATHRHGAKQAIDEISLQVQSKFHVEEMCLIDASGPEISRIVGKQIADDLSADESEAVFFEPGFALPTRKTYISPIYMSPDANRWVIAYVTPVTVGGSNKALLHYEHGLDVFQKALAKGIDGDQVFTVAVDDGGFVVADSRRQPAINKVGESEDRAVYFERFAFAGEGIDEVVKKIDGGASFDGDDGNRYQAAYKQVEGWTVLAFVQTQ